MHISSCAKAKTNVFSSLLLCLVLNWKGNGVFGKGKASTLTRTISFILCLTHKNLNGYDLSLISFKLLKGRKLAPKGDNSRPLRFLRFWCLMPKGEKVLGPKQKDCTTTFSKFKISIGISVGFKISFGIVSSGICFKKEIISKTLLIAKGRTSSGGAFI